VRLGLIELVIGAASGAAQFWMLFKFTRYVTSGAFDIKAALLGIAQFLLPVAVLLCCAFLLPGSLLWAAIGMAGVLILCALIHFIITQMKNKKV